MIYAVLTVITCVTIAVVEARANRKLKSDFVRMDVKGWVMSASITAALLIAFCFGYAVQGTSLEWVSPYIDPAVLALVCLVIVPLPMSVVRQALSEIFLVTPGDLKLHVDEVAKASLPPRAAVIPRLCGQGRALAGDRAVLHRAKGHGGEDHR